MRLHACFAIVAPGGSHADALDEAMARWSPPAELVLSATDDVADTVRAHMALMLAVFARADERYVESELDLPVGGGERAKVRCLVQGDVQGDAPSRA